MKDIHPWLRSLFYLGSLLSLIAGIQLFVLSEQTETYFAWTIQSPLTAATFGAFYFGTMVFGYLSGRERLWANVRGPALGLFAFLTITLLATLLHLDKFHFASQNLSSRVAAWSWMAIYVLIPPALLIMLVAQTRLQGNDPERTATMPSWIRAVLWTHGIVGIVLGLLLFFASHSIIPIWPWALTPLTARVLSAWLISFGIIGWQAARENDWHRVRITTIGYVIFGGLGMVAMARYTNEVDWLSLVNVCHIAYLLILVVIGVYGQIQVSARK